MSTVPIPQGATIADPSAPPPNGGGVAIPHGATLGDPIPAGASIGNAAAPAAPAAPAEEPSLADKINAMWNVMGSIDPDKIADRGTRELMQQLRGAMGVLKGAGQTVTTVSKAMHSPTAMRAALLANPVTAGLGATLSDDHLGHIAETLAPSSGIERMEKGSELHGLEEHVGAAGEMILEYMMGDEALKTLSIAQRMKKLAPVMQILEEHPRLAMATLAGIKNAALGGGQALLHGADVKDAAITGAITGVTAGAGELGGQALAKILPKTEDIAGQSVTKLASQEPGASPLAHSVAEISSEPALAAEQQGAAKAGIAATADQAAYRAGVGSAADFGDASEQVQQAAKGVYAKIDFVTKGKYSELRNAVTDAYKAGDSKAIETAEKNMDALFNKDLGRGVLDPADVQTAKDAWRTSKTLEALHATVEGAFNVGPEEVATRTGVYRGINGGMLQRRLTSLVGKVGLPELENAIGKEGVDNLYKIADLTSQPQRAAQFGDVARNVARVVMKRGLAMSLGALAAKETGMSPTLGAAAGEGLFEVMSWAVRKAATNPRVGNLMMMAVKSGASPKVYAPLIVQAMQSDLPEQVKQAAADQEAK